MGNTQCATEFWTSADVAREANRRGDSLTPAGVRVAAATGRLLIAATTPHGVRLFTRETVLDFLERRRAMRRGETAGQREAAD